MVHCGGRRRNRTDSYGKRCFPPGEDFRCRAISVIKSTALAAAVALVLGLTASPGHAQTYEPGPLPTIGPLRSETVETIPAPRDRTTIGVREEVKCRIDEATWKDTDYQKTTSGQVPVQDIIGDVTWVAVGQGTVDPAVGKQTTVKAAKKGGAVSVKARVSDSGNKGKDPVIEKELIFTVVEPGGVEVFEPADNTGDWAAGPPNNRIGANTKFKLQITPKNVNFKHVPFRVAYPFLPDGKFTWRDGTVVEVADTSDDFNVADVGGKNNVYDAQESRIGLDPITRLANQDFVVTFTYSYRFEADGTAWPAFFNGSSPREFQANGKARVGIQASNLLYGNWMGPWK